MCKVCVKSLAKPIEVQSQSGIRMQTRVVPRLKAPVEAQTHLSLVSMEKQISGIGLEVCL